MLPLPVSTFITQLVALLTMAAMSRIVILCAYYLRDIDIRLMYQENIFRHVGWYTDYNSTSPRKRLVFLLASLGLAAGFLPTFLSIAGYVKDNNAQVSYTRVEETSNSYYELSPQHFIKDTDPIFNNFYDRTYEPANSTGILLENYLHSINKKTIRNPSGVWYNAPAVYFSPEQQLRRWEQDDNYPPVPQLIDSSQQGVFSVKANEQPTYFLSYNTKIKSEGSFTLAGCVDNDSSRFNVVQAVRSMNHSCYPITDPSLWLIASQVDASEKRDSKLNLVDGAIFRSGRLNQQAVATYSMSVSASNWGPVGGQKVMMIKKNAHITVFYDDNSKAVAPESCVTASNSSKHLFHEDINWIACQLVASAKQNPTLPMLQATRRTFASNTIINSVYTYIKKNNGHGIMLDLTLLSAYYTSGRSEPMYQTAEVLISHQMIKKTDFQTTDYEQLLATMNPFPDVDTLYGLNTITDLVLAGTNLLAGVPNRDFLKTTAVVIPSIKASIPWIAMTCSLAVFSLLVCIAASRLTPEAYKTDLRSLLVHTLISQEAAFTSDQHVDRRKKSGLSTRAVRLKVSDNNGSLEMDGIAIVLSEKIPLKQAAVGV
ncbi:hypothetical protein PS6_007135 [Mucor atramentarius]